MQRMGIQEPPAHPNHEDEARELSAILSGMRMLIGEGQTPDEWSRYRLINGLRTIAHAIRSCPQGEVWLEGHKYIADWCEELAEHFSKREWDKLTIPVTEQGSRYFHIIDQCTSPLIRY